ncbi:MAG: DUF1015 family protein [Bacteroidota bacterium]
MHIHPFQAVYPNADLIASADYFFASVKEEFNHYVQRGFYKKLPQEGLYVHQIVGERRTYTGMIACLDILDYLDGNIKKHENTIAAAEQEQMRLMLWRNAMVKPVMLTYRNADDVKTILERQTQRREPFLEVHFEEVSQLHRFWEISDWQTIEQLQRTFLEQVPHTYIADGHHRISTTALMFKRHKGNPGDNPYRWLLSALYPASELEIHDFNRIIEGLNDLSPAVLMAKLSKLFEIDLLHEAQKPSQKHELTMYLDRHWFRLRWREQVLAEFSHQPVVLDVTMLNEKVLSGILGIKDVRTDARVKYFEGVKGLGSLKDKTLRSDERLAFCLYPVAMDDFLAVSDAGGILPPKSTWFEPRIRSGLLVKQL